MKEYFNSLIAVLKDWKKAIPVIILTVARIIYGLAWVKSGIGKIPWFSDGKLNSLSRLETVATNLAGPEVTRFDPLLINKAFAWIVTNVFAGMPGLTDGLVVIFEILVGVTMIIGFKIFYSALLATFMNLQFFASGSFNNFGYVWTNLIFMKFAKYAEVIGLDGILRVRKGKELV